jgi:tmRNA-binding protein
MDIGFLQDIFFSIDSYVAQDDVEVFFYNLCVTIASVRMHYFITTSQCRELLVVIMTLMIRSKQYEHIGMRICLLS